jgi:hypothetical protein
MSNEQNAAVSGSEDLPTTVVEGSQPSTDKASASPEEKKAYALDKRFGKLTSDIKSRDAQLAERDKSLESMTGQMSEMKAKIDSLTAPKPASSDLEFDNPEEFKRQNDAFNAHELTQVRNEAIQAAKVEFRQDLKLEREQEELTKQQAAFEQQANDHIKKGAAIGLTEEDMVTSARVLAQSGVPSEVQSFLFDDAEGPQIMDFLANNPKELAAMIEMPAIQQASYIERTIRVNAVSTKPTVTGAPQPLMNISGGGMQELDDFEKLCPGAEFK